MHDVPETVSSTGISWNDTSTSVMSQLSRKMASIEDKVSSNRWGYGNRGR